MGALRLSPIPTDPSYITAAPLHDIGQFLPASSIRSLASSIKSCDGKVGWVGHEALGPSYLATLRFPEKVVTWVGAHIPAKQFLCAVEKEYGEALSGASKVCLRFQVGPMVEEDVKAWKEVEWWEESIALRKCDDAAKEVDLEVAGVEAY